MDLERHDDATLIGCEVERRFKPGVVPRVDLPPMIQFRTVNYVNLLIGGMKRTAHHHCENSHRQAQP